MRNWNLAAFENTLSGVEGVDQAESLGAASGRFARGCPLAGYRFAEFLKRLTRNVADFPFAVLATKPHAAC